MYLIFFGKSQDFNYLAFDSNGWIKNFDSVIKNFESLESDKIETDNENNKPILAHYQLSIANERYSLIKFYGFAQSFDSSRIAGNLYGVALLSNKKIPISEVNLGILHLAFLKFGELALHNGKKFITSDFSEIAFKIWKAMVSSKDGNLMQKIETDQPTEFSLATKVFHVENLVSDPIEIFQKNSDCAYLYFSTDLPHLKRAQKKNKSSSFQLFIKNGDNFKIDDEDNGLIKEKAPDVNPCQSLLEYKEQQLEKSISENQKLSRMLIKLRIRYFLYLILACILLIALFFAWTPDKKENTFSPTEANVDLYKILSNDESLRNLNTIIINLQQFKLAKDSGENEKTITYAKAAIRDAKELKLEIKKSPFNDLTKIFQEYLRNKVDSLKEIQKVLDADEMNARESYNSKLNKIKSITDTNIRKQQIVILDNGKEKIELNQILSNKITNDSLMLKLIQEIGSLNN